MVDVGAVGPFVYRARRAIHPPVVMVLAACLAILSAAGYRAADIEIPPPVPFSSQWSQVSPDTAGEPLVIAALAVHDASQDVPTALSKSHPPPAQAATAERPHEDDVVGPPLPEPIEVAAATQGVSSSVTGAADSEHAGPPLPPWMTDGGHGVPVVVAGLGTDLDGTELAGPPLPGVHDRPAPSAGLVLASAIGPLPFDAFSMRPFRRSGSTAAEGLQADEAEEAAANAFDTLLDGSQRDDVHTVGYMREIRHRFRWGETMSLVLGRIGVAAAEAEEWIEATNDEYDVDRVYAGQQLELALAMPTSELQRMRMEIDPQTVLVVEREAGRVVARREEISYERTLRAVGGEILHSLYVSAQSHGIPDKIISDMAEILGWDVNFATDIEPGASFRVVYEELVRPDTMETISGRVLAVDLVNRGDRREGFYFKLPDGKHAGYYDRVGKGLGRSFLRFPVSFSRVSSNFSTARFHPILKRNIPHYGVDFAAPTGTPVKAVADGRVVKAGWYGGNGRFVKVQHDSVYETGYSHLSRITVKAGARVRKGQVIGYVGSTGLATGPHLHFAMYRYGKYVDPLRANLPRTGPLADKALAAFRMTVDMMDRAYAKAGRGQDDPTQVATAPSTTSAGGGGQ